MLYFATSNNRGGDMVNASDDRIIRVNPRLFQ
jgi:hypothetical protein